MKFKVGDKVRIKNNLKEIKDFAGSYTCELENYVGDIVTITDIQKSVKGKTGANVKENSWFWDFKAFEKVEEVMKKEDLKNGDIVTLKNGDKMVHTGYGLKDLEKSNNNPVYSLDSYDDDFKYYRCNEKYDVVKVERPVKYETVFEREEEVQELTVDEISERLGYKVKVVGEDR